MTPALVLICTPADRPGRYQVHLGNHRLLASARDPLTEAARQLLDKGVTGNTPLILRHAGAGHDALRSTVGAAARLTVKDSQKGVPTFVPWDGDLSRAEASPMRETEDAL